LKLTVSALCVGALTFSLTHAQQRGAQPGGQAAGPARLGFRVAPPTYQQYCGTCHGTEGSVADGKKAPSIAALQEYSPERVYDVLNKATAPPHSGNFTDLQKRQFGEFLSGRPMNSAAGDSRNMTNRCSSNPAMTNPASSPSWNGWGAGEKNARFQTAANAGLTAAQVPNLKLKWAFGLPNATEMYSQATIASGRVFFGSDAAWLYSLDAKTGCIYWSVAADAGIRSTPVIAPYRGPGPTVTTQAVYFTDVLTRVYAVDAQTGKMLWKTKAGDHPRAKSSNGLTVYDEKVYIGFSSMETTTGAVSTYECCSFRGHVVALNANTGARLWRTFVIAEEPKPRGKNAQGVTLYGPAGGAIWNVPTVDARRRRVYVGTGNAYTSPAAEGTDSVIAFDMESGKIVWQHQEVKGDAYINNCGRTSRGGDNCPETLGPDYDFGGSSLILHTLPDGRDILVAGTKGGLSMAFDPDKNGAVLWKTNLAQSAPGAAGLIVFGGASDGQAVYYGLNQAGAMVAAVNLADGARKWTTSPIAGARGGNPAATTAIPGVVFSHSADGTLRALATADGKTLFEYATAKDYTAVNGVPARGGAFGQSGSTVAAGMLFIGSGYNGQGAGGNAMLAFGLD
jgi:polyvinyl alcohol dehydrogenase (cytochrome)